MNTLNDVWLREKCVLIVDGKTQCCQDIHFSQIDLQLHYNPNQNASKLFCRYRQADSKVYTKKQKIQTANKIRKKNRAGGLILADFKTEL